MTWRLYAQRTTTGEWLHTDVPATLELTTQLNASGHAAGFIPTDLDIARADDGLPMFSERGTTIYAEREGSLEWVGLCSWQRMTPKGREFECKGLSSAYDLIGFDGRIKEWQPDPFDIVQRLIDNANRQPNGDVDLHVVTDGKAPTYAGDEQPPSPRPQKVKRRRGETKEDFAKRQDARAKDQADWDKHYGDREPYSIAWWEASYVTEEIAALAAEIPFEWWEQHRWSDRANLERRSELVLSPRRGAPRDDLRLVEGVNIAEVLDPTTDVDRYGNHVVMLGAGEGQKMRRVEIGLKDHRVRTTRFAQAKHVHNMRRLERAARDKFDGMNIAVKVDQAAILGDLGSLDIGDSVYIDTRLFSGWRRVQAITRSTRSSTVTLDFTPQQAGG